MSAEEPAARRLAGFAAGLRAAGVPAPVLAHARDLVLTTIGVGLAGATHPMVAAVRRAVLARPAAGGAALWDAQETADAPDAALVNATAAHVHDYDDTHAEGGVHVGAVVVPAALAAAAQREVDGARFLAAVVAGVEVTVRLGAAASHRFTERGLHASSCCGTVGAAVAASVVAGLPAPRIADAIGIACSQSSGVIQTVVEGGDLKSLHLGWAAHAGIWAARLAEQGVTGPAGAIDGTHGLFAALIGEGWSRHRLTRELGSTWDGADVILKPYPCCQFLHALVDAACAFRRERPGAVPERILLRLPTPARYVVCEPWADKLQPRTPYAAKFSAPYCVAAALLDGPLGLRHFTGAALARPDVRGLMSRVGYELADDPELTRAYGAELRIVDAAGERWSRRVAHPTGSPGADPTDPVRKFDDAASTVLDGRRRADLVARVAALPGGAPPSW
ncbi:MmgE/PrpD family protein [Phytohabitans sp. ZYX-F-186]|uniref:MmgE/PrpD family protein n=1 Tax=Phytohabitans maris TaxID=3071409 RepID=A0ABU0ZN86_9ACTN|nr:MmgE/PrpD family protein [Phytohabitans sp. ZYX-F-186]MDQ7908508.1 MmgE/PrpD family protein [Phytohabitans sp. ZYX-F-186]